MNQPETLKMEVNLRFAAMKRPEDVAEFFAKLSTDIFVNGWDFTKKRLDMNGNAVSLIELE